MKTIANRTHQSIGMKNHFLDRREIISPCSNCELKEMVERFPNCKGLNNNGNEFILEINQEEGVVKTARPHGESYDIRTYNLKSDKKYLDCEQNTIANYHPMYSTIETKTEFFKF